MTDLDDFKQYYVLADKLYETMTSEQILECLRIGAVRAGWDDEESPIH